MVSGSVCPIGGSMILVGSVITRKKGFMYLSKNLEFEEQFLLIPNRDSPNGYSTVMPAELQSVTLSH